MATEYKWWGEPAPPCEVCSEPDSLPVEFFCPIAGKDGEDPSRNKALCVPCLERHQECMVEIRYGVAMGDHTYPDERDPDYAIDPLLNEAMNLWSHAGYHYGCLIDGRDPELRPRQHYTRS